MIEDEHAEEEFPGESPEESIGGSVEDSSLDASSWSEDESGWPGDMTSPRADFTSRYVAKLIDFLIVGAMMESFTYVGPLAGIAYLLITDGLNGASPGKRIIGLRVISPERGGSPCDLRESALRNGVFALLIAAYVIVGSIPYVGPFVVFVAAAAVIFAEALTVYRDELGMRFGDRIAGTMVVKA